MVPYGGYMRAQDSAAYQARLAAGDNKIHYINTTGWLQSSDLETDGIHPTDNGHIKLAGLLRPFIPPYLSSSLPANDTLTVSSVNGTVALSPVGPAYVGGTVVTMTAIPSVGYAFTSWTGDITGTANPATITMDANKSVTANFTYVGTYVVQASSDVNGTITPSGTVPTTLGTARTFTMMPNSGYAVNQVTVDGASAGAVTTYTFPSTTTGTHSIAVTFLASAPVKLPISERHCVKHGERGNSGKCRCR